MPHYKYLIIGGGMTGDSAVHGIREVDPRGSIGVIGAESHRPYDRPPLSKALWKGKPLDVIWRKNDVQGLTAHRGRTARTLDAKNKSVVDEAGTVYSYDKLLLATGSTPRHLPFGGNQIVYFRTLDDYTRLRQLCETGQRFAVIGGGFIGSEIAAALAMNDKKVVLIFPGEAIGSHMFPKDLATFLNEYYRSKGVEVLAGHTVTGMDTRNCKAVLKIQNADSKTEREEEVDGVVAGIGVEPNVELARSAGLQVENGIRVDTSLRTSQPDIFAAGDVASFHSPALDKWLRVEHEDNANTMGRQAGRAMAGATETYTHLPSFYSDLFDLGYEAVGETDSRLEVVADWKQKHREGVVYYLRNGRVRGVLLWNVWEQVDAARKLIAEPGPFVRRIPS
jgi:3-phenylpropionate/trans-cinnamate dioxygenase ferredoxin reductase component